MACLHRYGTTIKLGEMDLTGKEWHRGRGLEVEQKNGRRETNVFSRRAFGKKGLRKYRIGSIILY